MTEMAHLEARIEPRWFAPYVEGVCKVLLIVSIMLPGRAGTAFTSALSRFYCWTSMRIRIVPVPVTGDR